MAGPRSQAPRAALAVCLAATGCLWLGLPASASASAGEGGYTITLFPVDDPYRDGLAGPYRRGFAVTRVDLAATDIADSGERLFGLHAGGRFGLLRLHSRGRPERGWQLGVEAGFYGQFDIERSYDSVGWDGFYGLVLTAAPSDVWAVKVGVLHTSSHVGDEYAERTGRRRIGYTREEVLLGLSRALGRRLRARLEGGWAYDLRNEELQEAERLALDVEYLAAETLWRGMGWYAAAAGSSFAERDWRVDWSVDVGLLLSPWPRRWRFGLQYYDGRAPLGEFFQNHQRSLTLGLWLDL